MKEYNKFKKDIADLNDAEKITAILEFGKNTITESPETALLAYRDAQELAHNINDKYNEAEARLGICHYHFLKEEFVISDQLFSDILSLLNDKVYLEKSWKLCNWYAYKYFKYGNYDKTLHFFNLSLDITLKLDNKELQAGSLGNIATIHSKLAHFPEAEKFFLESISIQKSIKNYLGLARTYNQIAELYFKSGRSEKSLEAYLNALSNLEEDKEAESKEGKSLYSIILNNIANMYFKLENYDEALHYYKRSLAIKEELNDEKSIALSLCNIAVVYKEMQNFDQALSHYDRALKINKKLNLRTQESLVYQNLGALYSETGDLDEALRYFKNSEKLRRTFNDPYSLVITINSIISVLLEIDDLENAEKYLLESLQLSKGYNFQEKERDVYEYFIEYWDRKKDDSQSNLFRKKFINLNRELFQTEFSENLAEMQTRFETELKEKEAEIYLLKTIELEKKNKQIEKQKIKLENTLEELHRSEINYTFASRELKKTLGATIVGESKQIKKILNLISKVANTESTTVLITGESGTGKELIARAIHDISKRKAGNFCAVNVSSIPETLFESEFFGHKKNAFTGAESDKPGWFEIAHNGTLFLDEIGTLPQNLQIKLLRVLEERKIVRIGSHKEIPVDIRIISATNSNLLSSVENGVFRSDLYHRLSTFVINIPPLRDRVSDIPILLEHFVNIFGKQMNKKIIKVERKVETELMSYHFPGNVRELRNLVERAIIMCNSSTLKWINFNIQERKSLANKNCVEIISLDVMEKEMLLKALKVTGFHQTKAATLLGIQPKAIERRMIKYGIKKI
ncbi:MAG: sigma 54-interacting transcriptional regulator [Candidatus Cloacimonadales bacterium]|nr:sigma 54-interacting transcriptional regulator [Candidatus Cloacimonadales bacterium]